VDAISLAKFLTGLVLLGLGAEVLVRSASRAAAALGISPLVIGLTVVAYGTGAPELAVCVRAALGGGVGSDLAVGNVVGSNIFNVLFILGLSAALAPLVVSRQLVRIDVPILIGAVVLLGVFALDGEIGRLEAGALFAGVLAYTVFAVRLARAESAARPEAAGDPALSRGATAWLLDLALFGVGLALLVLGARWLVDGAIGFARALGVSELVIGLTIVAVGTSLPEVATSLVAALRGERDLAVGNVIGSNLFNVLAVLGLTGLVAPGGLRVAPAISRFDLPVMLAVCFACLPIFARRHRLARWEGLLFLGYYVAYVLYVVLAATEHDALPRYSAVMLEFVLPLTAVTLAVLLFRALPGGGPAPRA
jgi:cation:H+ antiporter